ncbi:MULTISPECIES: PIG-L deacetylase family protein [Saccharothrix]|uniref:PIG-L deacetylase family protein n=1 Tax=Saccharothrix TaxID=2071 RepID=UPI00093C04BF|nr:PIG-L deacetylase family protein [Saccharothrix sp. CB00851]OKI36435.1 GlcNAc-PI de-N-acetylase [Saccharothrix sp. CB00851]
MAERLELLPDDWQRALAIIAHPDDMEYGVAGAVAEWTAAGREVSYLLVTRGEAGIDGLPPDEAAVVREAEQRASAAVVGVSTVDFLDGHHDGVIEGGVALRRELAREIRRHRPELVVTINHHDTWDGSSWNTPDHRVVGRAVLDAVGDAGNRWIFPEQLADGAFQPWDGVRHVAVAGSPHPTHVVTVGEKGFELSVAALAEHRAYLGALRDEDPAAQARGTLTQIMSDIPPGFGAYGVTFQLYGR